MYIGLSWGSYNTGNEDAIRRVVQNQVIPGMNQQPGFDGYLGGINRTAGKFVGLGFWETREQVQAMNAPPAALASLVQPQLNDSYRIVIFTAGFLQSAPNGGTSPALCIALGSYKIGNESLLTRAAGERFLPIIHTFPGSLGILTGVQQSVGKILHVSGWKSADQAKVLEAQRSTFESLVQFQPAEMYEITAQAMTP